MEHFVNFNESGYPMVATIKSESEGRKMSDITTEEVHNLIEQCTPYGMEDINGIAHFKLRESDHVNIEIMMRDREGNRIENARGNLVILSPERMFFSSYVAGAVIDFNSLKAEQYLKSQNFS